MRFQSHRLLSGQNDNDLCTPCEHCRIFLRPFPLGYNDVLASFSVAILNRSIITWLVSNKFHRNKRQFFNLSFYILQSVHYDVLKTSVKGKQSLYGPGQVLRVPGGSVSQISWQSTHEGGKVVSPRHQSPLPPGKYTWYSFPLEVGSTPGPSRGRKD